jgi:hypothetical protein
MTLQQGFASELFGDDDRIEFATTAVGFVDDFLWGE